MKTGKMQMLLQFLTSLNKLLYFKMDENDQKFCFSNRKFEEIFAGGFKEGPGRFSPQ